ncbi:MAG: TIGR03936 family radical SAM-associated protein [Psychrilyobacter sp.]|uniref:TIGR03936 family radical SAM-associated protein n=1 Tax=Psychrilyobacter sp. TaxID=2586924 RepID=UPI003C728066
MKKRIVFDRIGDMKYISHLDTIRFLERLFKKTGITIKHSEGFTPRPKLSFGNPVSLGDETYNELMDAEVISDLSNEEIVKLLNSNSPEGFEFHEIYDVPKKSGIANDFDILIYEVEGATVEIDSLENLLSSEEIIEVREKKGKTQERNLKEKIADFKRIGNKIFLELYNISPKGLFTLAEIDTKSIKVTRMGYKKSN